MKIYYLTVTAVTYLFYKVVDVCPPQVHVSLILANLGYHPSQFARVCSRVEFLSDDYET